MPEPRIIRGAVVEGGGSVFNDARIVHGSDGSVIQPGDLTGNITLHVFQVSGSSPNATFHASSFTAASLVSASLATWDVDTVGRNFRHQVLPQSFSTPPEGGQTYRFVYVLPTSTEGNAVLVFEWHVEAQERH